MSRHAAAKTFKTTIYRDGSMCFIPLTFDPKDVFGKVRASWPDSPLAEEALLRQAEAASHIGDMANARRFAEQYDREYPNGGRRAEIRRFAHLD